jgi:NADPH2:quinone reductase
MQAIQIEETGGPEVLHLAEIAPPEPVPGELLVNVEWAGLNYIDTYQRDGLYPMSFPFVPGLEGAGTVTAVGDGVERPGVGDRVAWTGVLGSYAERVAVPAHRAVPVPDHVATDIAAATLLQGITAHYLARDTFPLTPGDKCLVHAAAGGVGRLLVQIAKRIGAEVFATVGSDEKAALAESAGADHVINYERDDFKEVIEGIAGPHPLDVVYDGVGAATFDRGLDLLRPRGLMVAFGNASGPPDPLNILTLAGKGSLYVTRPTIGHYSSDEELVTRSQDLFSWIGDGTLEVRIGATFALANASDAHRALEGRGVAGKILLEI